MNKFINRTLKLYALPADQDFIPWFSDHMFKGHRKSAQELAEMANTIVHSMLSRGEQNYKEAREENKHIFKKHIEFLAKQAKKDTV